MAKTTYSKEARYELFKLLWMVEHEYTIKDLLDSILAYRAEMAEEMADDPDALAELDKTLLENWELESGFDGSVWPCMDEFLSCDDPILKKDGTYTEYASTLEALTRRFKKSK